MGQNGLTLTPRPAQSLAEGPEGSAPQWAHLPEGATADGAPCGRAGSPPGGGGTRVPAALSSVLRLLGWVAYTTDIYFSQLLRLEVLDQGDDQFASW